MYETRVTIVGNVLNAPESRRVLDNQALVTTFKIAATSRRFDRGDEQWVDGDTLRVRVNCWRALAENVARSINVGDPVVVYGRLFSRDWQTDDHVRRISYELDAHTVGHDLSRGRAKFARIRPQTGTTAIDDELAGARPAAEDAVPADDLNGLPRRQTFDADLDGFVTLVEERDPFSDEVLATLAASPDAATFAPDDDALAAELAALTADPHTDAEADDEVDAEDADDPEAETPPTAASTRPRRRPKAAATV